MLTRNIWGYLWGKLTYGAMLFATALTNESIADALADAALPPDCCIELGARGRRAWRRREGVRPRRSTASTRAPSAPGGRTRRSQRSLDDLVAHNRRSAKSHSGIWRDLAVRKRRTEVDAQLGPIVPLGRRHGVPTPLTRAAGRADPRDRAAASAAAGGLGRRSTRLARARMPP